jgi:peroxiredoxin
VFDFKLSAALKRGPVVLYFYPAAFTPGCTIEAHDFAEHIGDYKDLGATVIGVSVDPIATLQKFSVSACRSKFAVASDARAAISKAYDAVLGARPAVFSNRTSYVIAKDGTIFYAYTALDPGAHVRNTLVAAARVLRRRKRKEAGRRPASRRFASEVSSSARSCRRHCCTPAVRQTFRC